MGDGSWSIQREVGNLVTQTAKKSLFYDFLARYGGTDFESYMAASKPDEDYLNWNGYTLPYVFEDEEKEYLSLIHI